MKLKTLEDLKDKENTNYKKYCRIAWNDFVYIKELKAEAVKWVKEDKKSMDKGTLMDEGELLSRWMERLDITEEDLK